VPGGGEASVDLVLSSKVLADPFAATAAVMEARRAEADAFYDEILPR
jgi:hypothetical protein